MQRFDFGHLEILEVLLEEESVSRAAARLHLSASALSRTLTKIRESLGDDLLTPAGRELTITRRGIALRREIKKLNDQARTLLGSQKEINPREIRRTFRIRASDYSTALIGTRLIKEVNKLAPESSVGFVVEGKEDIEAFRRGVIDFDIGVNKGQSSEIVTEHLVTDEFVCVYSKHAKIAKSKITLHEFLSRPHIITSRKAKTFVLLDELLEKAGKKRQVLGSVSSFHEALYIASQSDVLVIVPMRLAEMLKNPLQLTYSALPLKTPAIEITLNWHSKNKNDLEHQWLRNLIFKIAPRS